ncbi:MAG: fibrobacter succinogenes major paralogous domain-containing protein [Bacteroidota bacterium]
MKILSTIFLAFCLIASISPSRAQGGMRDREGNNYKTFVIANNIWMAENLNVSHYRNGDAIPEAKSHAEWDRYCESKTGCWAYYNFSAANGHKYGRLYNWYAVDDKRGLAPSGWHIPKDVEWLVFTNIPNLGLRPGLGMKNTWGWKNGEDNCSGSNDTGFTGLPGGILVNGKFESLGLIGQWWCATETEVSFARTRSLWCDSDDLWLMNTLKQCGNSVRCVKN